MESDPKHYCNGKFASYRQLCNISKKISSFRTLNLGYLAIRYDWQENLKENFRAFL